MLATFLAVLSVVGIRTGMPPATNVTTAFGTVQGAALQQTVQFQGVPFATADRFEPPADWSKDFPNGIFDATGAGIGCPQPSSPIAVWAKLQPAKLSEECLALNIWAPLKQPIVEEQPALLPVMVFIHGGAFVFGGACACVCACLLVCLLQ